MFFRHSYRLNAGLFIVGLLCAAPVLGSARPAITNIQATPTTIFLNQPTVVTVSAQVGTDPTLIVSSADIIQYDNNLRPIGVVGALYDDGTHGDVTPNDGLFTGQLTLTEPASTTIYLRASVAYKGSLLRVLSTYAQVNVSQQPVVFN